jgi:serine/threonine-protein kinase RsbW
MHPHSNPFRAGTVNLALEPHMLQIHVHSPAELRSFSDALEVWMRTIGYAAKDMFAVRLVLREAVINAFRHGNRSDPSKSIFVRYLLTTAEVLLEVEDQGHGFDPNQVPDPLHEPYPDRPGGRGLFLMRSYMTWVSFNREGNRVTFCRRRSHS